MDWNSIIGSITDLGVNVFVIIAAFAYINKESDKNRDERKEMNEAHTNEMNKLSEAVNNNTVVMQRIVEILRGNEDDIK